MRVAFFGTYDERRHPRVEVLREGLIARGHDVVVCNSPSGIDTETRVAVASRPWRAVGLLPALTRNFLALRRLARAAGTVDVVVVGYLGVLDVHLARRWFDATVVLDHLAPVSATLQDRRLGGLRAKLGAAIDRWAESASDLIVMDTEEHAEALAAPSRPKSVVVAVGAPERWFRARRSARSSATGPLRVIFFGLYTPLQGVETIAKSINLVPTETVNWTLVGSGQDRILLDDAIANPSNVTRIDWVEPDELPELVADHDVCLGIFGSTPKALRVVPNKVFQGLAAGCVVVTSGTECQRRVLDEAAVLVAPADSAALTAALTRLAGHKSDFEQQQDAGRDRADRYFRPGDVVEPLARRLEAELSARA